MMTMSNIQAPTAGPGAAAPYVDPPSSTASGRPLRMICILAGWARAPRRRPGTTPVSRGGKAQHKFPWPDAAGAALVAYRSIMSFRRDSNSFFRR